MGVKREKMYRLDGHVACAVAGITGGGRHGCSHGWGGGAALGVRHAAPRCSPCQPPSPPLLPPLPRSRRQHPDQRLPAAGAAVPVPVPGAAKGGRGRSQQMAARPMHHARGCARTCTPAPINAHVYTHPPTWVRTGAHSCGAVGPGTLRHQTGTPLLGGGGHPWQAAPRTCSKLCPPGAHRAHRPTSGQGYTQYGGLRPFGVSLLYAGW